VEHTEQVSLVVPEEAGAAPVVLAPVEPQSTNDDGQTLQAVNANTTTETSPQIDALGAQGFFP
jgi:hypothetical protein